MSFQEFVSTTASIVAIVGGVLGIISTFSKNPVFTRFWQGRRATSQTSLVVQPSSVLSKPVLKATPSSGAQKHPPQSLPTNRLKLGLIYGVISGVLCVLIMMSIPVFGQTQSSTYILLAFGALVILSIAAGLLSSRVSGSVLSAIIAGGLLGLFGTLTAGLTSTDKGLYYDLVAAFALFGVPLFILSTLSGLLGRHLYKKFQVPAPNENTSATVKQLSKNDAQQLQQAPHYARQSTPGQVKCPNCNATNSNGARFCNQCGTKLT